MAQPPETVGERLRREREKAGLSLAQLAALAGLSKPYLLRLETTDGNPSLQILMRLATALDLTIADLVGGPRFEVDRDEQPVPPSLRVFAEEARLTTSEVRTLASIRFRKGEAPTSVERWKYIHDSLRLSKGLDQGGTDADE